jgi:hypothetical protein
MSTDNLFFDETREQSIIKANIVSSYFWAWAKVIIPAEKKRGGSRVAYIDLFAGPGRYKDGTKSTPLLVLERAIRDPEMREVLVTMFNDKDENNSRSLELAISELPNIEKLKGCGSFKTTPPRLFNQSEMGSFVLASRVWSLPGYFPVGIVRRVVALLFLLQMETPVRLKIAADPQRPQA